MKRLIAAVLAAVFVLSFSGSAFAKGADEYVNEKVLKDAPVDYKALIKNVKPAVLPKMASRQEGIALTDTFSGGSGTEADPFLISSYEDLRRLSEISNRYQRGANRYLQAHYKLTKDIAMPGSKELWLPIYDFEGVFDGDGHTVSGMFVYFSKKTMKSREDTRSLYTGLFGSVIRGGTVQNLTVSDSVVIHLVSAYCAGAVVGDASGFILNCHTTDSVTVVTNFQGGGIAGTVGYSAYVNSLSDNPTFAELRGCTNAALVMGAVVGDYAIHSLGGVTAFSRCPVSDCENSGTVFSPSLRSDAGGVVCSVSDTLCRCKNTGSVTAGKAGGICSSFNTSGLNAIDAKPYAEMSDCVNEGSVCALEGDAAGICAALSSGLLKNCRNTGDISIHEDAENSNSIGGIFASLINSPLGESTDVFSISGCENTGAISTGADMVIASAGGIGGCIFGSALSAGITDCLNSGKVSCPQVENVGGILGNYSLGDTGRSLNLSNCKNSGAVTGYKNIGGILGSCSSSIHSQGVTVTLKSCNNSGALTSRYEWSSVGGLCGYFSSLPNCPLEMKISDCANTGAFYCPDKTKAKLGDEIGWTFTGKDDKTP